MSTDDFRPRGRIQDEEGAQTTAESSTTEISEATSTQPLTAHRNTRSPSPSPSRSRISRTNSERNGTRRAILSARKVRAAGKSIWRWVRGPEPPQTLRITPLWPDIQSAPLRLLNIICPKRKHKLAAYITFVTLWITVFTIVVHYSRFETRTDPQYGRTANLACSNAVWLRNNGCGIDGQECRPFKDELLPFRCPSQCLRGGRLLNFRAVGDQSVIYQPFVVGGPPSEAGLPHGGKYNATYRADSFICAAALHAGVVSNRFGGCGLMKMTGEKSLFPSSRRHGIDSVGFDANFPASFTFLPISSRHCMDLRWHLLPVTIFFTVMTVLFISPAKLCFFTIFVGVFFHVAFSSDPPNLMDPNELVSLTLARFLPDSFIAYVLGIHVVNKTINFPGQIEKVVLWLGGLWVGALNNLTFDPLIPIARLTPRDLAQEPGAKAALAIVIIVLLCIAISQIYFIRLTGKLPKYLLLYVGFGVTLGLLTAIPGQHLRIHHYILSLLLLPGTAFQTRPSLLYQGILSGLHINGIARWGFASILETPYALPGEGAMFSRIPRFEPNPVVTDQNVTIFWNATDSRGGFPSPWEGISLLVNDVERLRSKEIVGNFTLPRLLQTNSTMIVASDEFVMPTDSHIDQLDAENHRLELALRRKRKRQDGVNAEEDEVGPVVQPVYLRIAYMRGTGARVSSGDYTKGGVVLSDGTWIPPSQGRT